MKWLLFFLLISLHVCAHTGYISFITKDVAYHDRLHIVQTANNTNRHNDRNIYYQALLKYAESKYDTVQARDTIYILQNYLFLDSLLPGNNYFHFKVLEYKEICNHAKGKGFSLLGIFPLSFVDGVFIIHFVPYGASYKRRKHMLYYTSGDSYDVIFHYKDGVFVFDRFKVIGM